MEIPRVYANPINKKIDNVQDLFRSDKDNKNINTVDLTKKINEIFASKDHVYKSKVHITLKDRSFDTQIVGRTNINLLTLDGSLIKITDIVDIEKI